MTKFLLTGNTLKSASTLRVHGGLVRGSGIRTVVVLPERLFVAASVDIAF